MTSTPLTATRAALGAGLLATVLLASGCNARVAVAAAVRDDTVSTKTLNTYWRDASQTSAGRAAGDTLEQQVLAELVQTQRVLTLAADDHVTVGQGALDKRYDQLTAEYVAASASSATSADPTEAFRLSTPALRQSVATQDVYTVALGEHYRAQTHQTDSVQLTLIPVKDEATAKTVVNLLETQPDNTAAIAKQYSSDPQQAASGGDYPVAPFTQLPAQIQQLPVGQATVLSAQGQTLVVRVDALMDSSSFAQALRQLPVRINPRFGTWGPVTGSDGVQTYTVISTNGSDLVAPNTAAPPSVALPSADTGQQPPATAPAPQASTPPQSEPPATAAPASSS